MLPKALQNAIDALGMLPGVGPRTAESGACGYRHGVALPAGDLYEPQERTPPRLGSGYCRPET